MGTIFALVAKFFPPLIPDMLPLVLFTVFWRTLLSADPAHLRPGARSTRLGTVHLVEDVMWVRYPYAPMRSVPRLLRSIPSAPNSLMLRLEESVPRNTEYSRDSFTLFAARFTYINESVSLALETVLLILMSLLGLSVACSMVLAVSPSSCLSQPWMMISMY